MGHDERRRHLCDDRLELHRGRDAIDAVWNVAGSYGEAMGSGQQNSEGTAAGGFTGGTQFIMRLVCGMAE